MRWLLVRTLVVGVLVSVGLMVALTIWLGSDDFQVRAKLLAEVAIEHQLGEQLSVSRLDLRYFPPSVDIQGINLFHEPTGDTILSAERIQIPIVLTTRGPRLGRLRLQRPVLQLHLEEDGTLRELRDRKRGGRPLEELPFESLEIVDGRLGLIHPSGEVAFRGLFLEPTGAHEHRLLGDLLVRQDAWEQTSPLRIDGLVIGPTAVSVPALDLHTDPLDLSGDLTVPLQGELTADLTLHARLEELTGLLPPPRALHGTLDADLELRGPPRALQATVTAWGRELGFDAPGKRTPILHYRFGEATAAAQITRDRIVVEDLTVRVGDGSLRATGLIDPRARELVDARIVGDAVELYELLVQLDAAPRPWVDMLADAEIRARGSLKPLHLEGEFDLDVADLRVDTGPVRTGRHRRMLSLPTAWARGTLVLEPDHVQLVAPEIHAPRSHGRVDVTIGFGPYGPLDLKAWLDTDLRDVQPLGGVELAGRGPIEGRLWGPFDRLRFEGTGDVEGFAALGIPFADRLEAPVFRSPDLKSLELRGATAHVGASRYGGDLVLDFRPPIALHTDLGIDDGRVEDILGIFLDLDGVKGRMSGQLGLHGPLFAMDGEQHFTFEEVSLWDERFTEGRGDSTMVDGRFTLDDLRVLRGGGEQGLMLRGTVQEAWSLDMDLVADGFTLQTLDHLAPRQLPLSGRLGGHAHLGNTLFEPEPHGRLTLREVRYAGQPLDDSEVRFTTRGGVMALHGDLVGGAVAGGGSLGLWEEQPYALAADLHAFPVHLLYPRGEDGTPITATASGFLELSGHFGEHPSPVGLEGTLEKVDIAWSGHELTNRSPWRYRQYGNAFELESFDLVGGLTDFSVAATRRDRLELDGTGTLELDLLRAVVPGLTRAQGVATVDLDVTGTGRDVEAVVDIDVEADLLRHETVPVAFEEVDATLRLTPERFELQKFEGRIGGGTIEGSGTIEAADWTPERYDLAAAVRDAQVQWVETLPPAVGDADLRFDGPADALLLAGEVRVEDMVFADRIDWEDWVVEYRSEVMVDPTLKSDADGAFSMDVHIRADEAVRFRNNLAEGLASADLRITGDTVRPGLVGTVRVEDAEVLLQDRTFRVDRGEVTYTDPWSWDPDVDFDLVTDIESRDQRYRVNYSVFGPFSDWQTSTRSDPGLPQADVNALLWFGVTTDELEQSGELPTAVAQGVADLLLTDLFASTQASELGEVPDLLFDRIDVATGVNGRGEYSAEPRLVVAKRLADLGDVDLTWEFNLGRPDDNYVRVDKRVGGVWSIAGWYATLQRERVLPIGGAYGIDVTARWEMD